MRCLIVLLTTNIIMLDFAYAKLPTNLTDDDYLPYGPQVNISTDVVLLGGWSECFVSPYSDHTGFRLTEIINQLCTEDYLMMACRKTGSSTIQLLAWAHREDVLFNTGIQDITHNAQGAGWYYYNQWSWGFVIEGEDVHRDYCDYHGDVGYTRLCWDTFKYGGWRCGEDEGLF